MVWYLPDLKESLSGIGDRVYGTFAFLFNQFVMLFEISRDYQANAGGRTPPLIHEPATGCALFDYLPPLDHWRLMLYSLECLVTEKGPQPTLSALNEAALAHIFDVIRVRFDEAIEYEDGTEEAMIEQMKTVRREATWDSGCNAAEEEEILAAQA